MGFGVATVERQARACDEPASSPETRHDLSFLLASPTPPCSSQHAPMIKERSCPLEAVNLWSPCVRVVRPPSRHHNVRASELHAALRTAPLKTESVRDPLCRCAPFCFSMVTCSRRRVAARRAPARIRLFPLLLSEGDRFRSHRTMRPMPASTNQHGRARHHLNSRTPNAATALNVSFFCHPALAPDGASLFIFE